MVQSVKHSTLGFTSGPDLRVVRYCLESMLSMESA